MTIFPETVQPRLFAQVKASLPPEYPDADLLARIRSEIERSRRKVVVLDDDPTGPQAMRDVFILTEWGVEALKRELLEPRPLFFVLTNTRSMPTAQAVALHRQIAANLLQASRECGVAYSLISRGDSTLRGHYPDEVEALGEFDGTIITPFFEEGGRFTLDDVQWVREKEQLIPAAQTPYAHDLMFGYNHSNLSNWVEEKSRGRISAQAVIAIPLQVLREEGPAAVERILLSSHRQTIILNAMSYHDLEVFTLGLLHAESQGKRFVVRSAASFVRVRGGQGASVEGQTFEHTRVDGAGGLIIVGSHVPKSSAQLAKLLNDLPVVSCELRVSEIAAGRSQAEVERIGVTLNTAIEDGHDALVYTTRAVQTSGGKASLDLGSAITSALIQIVRTLTASPRFIVTKGGWTASEIGVRALDVKRAYEPAPILPGVPMWVLGEESRFPRMSYVIFPGNVGDENALADAVRRLNT